MRLLYEIFGVSEAGVAHKATAEPKARRRWPDTTDHDDGDDGDEVPEFGASDVPDEEPPPEFGSSEQDAPEPDWAGNEGEPEGEDEPAEPPADPEDELDPRNDRKFASEPQRSAPKAAPAPAGLTLSGDPGTLDRLRDALEQLAGSPRVDEDLADWLDECVRAIDQAGRRHEPTVSLPRFSATPDLDDFDEDEGDDGHED